MDSNQKLLSEIDSFSGPSYEFRNILKRVGRSPNSEVLNKLRDKYERSKNRGLKTLIKNYMELINPESEFEKSRFIFPGNFTIDEIKKILVKTSNRVLSYMALEWNRFEKNRILNALEKPNEEKIMIPYLSGYLREKEYNNFLKKIRLMETTGQIIIREELSAREQELIRCETKDLYGIIYSPEILREKFDKIFFWKQTISQNYLDIVKSTPELKGFHLKSYFDFFVVLSDYTHRYGVLSIEPYLSSIPDLLIQRVLKIEIDGGDRLNSRNLIESTQRNINHDYEQLLTFIFSQIASLMDSSGKYNFTSNYDVFYPQSSSGMPPVSFTEINHEEKLMIWEDKLDEYLLMLKKPTRSLYEILSAIHHYNLIELIPKLEDLYQKNKEYHCLLKNALEILGSHHVIENSKMVFPGNFTLQEINTIMEFLDEDSLKAFSIRWNRFERNQILNTVDNPEEVFEEIKPHVFYSSLNKYNYNNALKKLEEVIVSLEKAEKITVRSKPRDEEIIKDIDSEMMRKYPLINPFQDEGPSEDDIRKLIDAASQLPASIVPHSKSFQAFLEETYNIIHTDGVLSIEDYLPFLKDSCFNEIFQSYMKGMDRDVVTQLIIKPCKKRLMSEFNIFIHFLTDCLNVFLEGGNLESYEAVLFSYYPEMSTSDEGVKNDLFKVRWAN